MGLAAACAAVLTGRVEWARSVALFFVRSWHPPQGVTPVGMPTVALPTDGDRGGSLTRVIATVSAPNLYPRRADSLSCVGTGCSHGRAEARLAAGFAGSTGETGGRLPVTQDARRPASGPSDRPR